MDLFSLAAKLSLDSSDYTKGIGNAEGMLSKVGASAKKIGVAMAGTLTAAAGAVAGLTKQAVEAYSQFEQLQGGVETLFKSSVDEVGSAANTVMENAKKAFETAGMSANEYMETVTSFSASLIQSTGRGAQTDLEELKSSLDGEYNATKRSLQDQYDERKKYWDERIRLTKKKANKESLKKERDEELKSLKRQNEDTLAEMKKHNKERLAEAEAANSASETSEESLARAAELADMAIVDMSDNANKMGTDISSIQNAYSGFAKQNYTMLDNLKLGYGGTKEEMERLLKDAENLSGKKYDLSSYADIVEAIHVIQTEMGISGISAEEAAELIEKGLLTEEEAFEKMGTTAKEASTTIEGSSKAMKAAWENMLVSFADKKGNTKKATQNLVRTAKTYFKNISPVITQAISGIGDFLTEIAPMIGEELPGIVADIVPKLFSAGKKLIAGLAKGVMAAIKKVKWPSWSDVKAGIQQAWNTIVAAVSNLGGLIFGRDEEGKVKWPTWADVKKAAEDLWRDIKNLVADFAGLIFGRDSEGKVKYPTWEDVKTAITGAWDTIVAEASKLTGFNLGDISSVEELIGKIIQKWTELRSTIEEKAIEIGTYFFGEGKEKEVADAIKTVLDVLVALGAGFVMFKAVTGVQKIVSTLQSLFSMDVGTNKMAIILSAIATAFMLIVQNWDTIQPVLESAWGWINDNIITPMSEFFGSINKWVTQAIKDIKRLLGIDEGSNGVLSEGQADNLRRKWGDVEQARSLNKSLNGANAEGVKVMEDKFFASVREEMEKAGASAEQIDAAINKIKEQPEPDFVRPFIDNLTKANEEVSELEKAVENVDGTYDLVFNVTANDPYGLLSPGQTGVPVDTTQGRPSYSGPNHTVLPDDNNAKGNWNVPYDNFLANLHRNEMVLSASQARDYRNGGTGGIDLAGLTSAIISAVREGMENATVKSYLNGRDITDEVNRLNIQGVKARRFAT